MATSWRRVLTSALERADVVGSSTPSSVMSPPPLAPPDRSAAERLSAYSVALHTREHVAGSDGRWRLADMSGVMSVIDLRPGAI